MSRPKSFSEHIHDALDARGWDTTDAALAAGYPDEELGRMALVFDLFCASDEMEGVLFTERDAAMFNNAFGGGESLWRRRWDAWRSYRRTITERMN